MLKKFENSSRKTIAKQSMSLQTPLGSVTEFQQILTENVNMCCTAAKFVPRILTNDQKQRCINVCLELQEKANEDPTFTCNYRNITGDESWIYDYNTKTKQQLSQWKSPQSPRTKKERQV
jgi:hypothetical protein